MDERRLCRVLRRGRTPTGNSRNIHEICSSCEYCDRRERTFFDHVSDRPYHLECNSNSCSVALRSAAELFHKIKYMMGYRYGDSMMGGFDGFGLLFALVI